jgi:hypothetical protein
VTKLMSASFTCSRCKGTFEKGWSEEEAAAELARDFAGHRQEDCDELCEDCYQRFMRWFRTDEVSG